MTNPIKKFGTAPVFFTAISTILGAIMFLRFGFAVGQVGFIGTVAIILIGHAVTIPTAMAIAEIATNQKVEGGGEYFIISRSFGLVIGAAIGIALYFSQAISVAFYVMAFAEAFTTLFEYLIANFDLPVWLIWLLNQKQTVGIPALLLLTGIVLTKGADLGVKALYIVVSILAVSLVAFFIADTDYSKQHAFDPTASIKNISFESDFQNDTVDYYNSLDSIGNNPESVDNASPIPKEQNNSPLIPLGFFTVFAIIFPAFTGMTAGVGLSGDLENPGKSIPYGTMMATIGGMIIYFFIAYKLTISAPPEALADTSRLIMADIAIQGWWLIPLGLAAATISSALGSIMVAPRTLQAIGRDKIFPSVVMNEWLSKGKGKKDEPFNASVITVAIAFVFILLGALDAVAVVISMFFMVTYGSLCLISFLQHFAADPSYRPKFRSKWYLSLFGALACFGLMFFMNAFYAFIALVAMTGLYLLINHYNPDKKNMAIIFQGVIFQISRQLHVFLQKAKKEQTLNWRPSAICFSERTFERLGAFDLLRWISQRYGFGTYIHQITGYLSRAAKIESADIQKRLIHLAESSKSNVYVDTLISPSYTSAIAQVIQLPSISGTDNNLIMFEYSKNEPQNIQAIIDNFKLIKSVDFDILLLGSSERGYGLKKEIHIWITSKDYSNANLMILLGFIIIGHKDWNDGEIKIFAIFPMDSIESERRQLLNLIDDGQLPISPQNVKFISREAEKNTKQVIAERSRDADLTIVGFRDESVKHVGKDLFSGYDSIGNVLFVNSAAQKKIKKSN